MKKTFLLLSSLLLTGLLAACNLTNVFPTADLTLTLIDQTGETLRTVSQIVFSENYVLDADTDVCEFVSVTLPTSVRIQANARPGSIGTTITGYSIDYFKADGTEVATATGESYRGSLGLTVPDGVVCPATPEGQAEVCTLNTPGAEWAEGEIVRSAQFIPADADIWSALSADPTRQGAYASIVVDGVDANGNPYSQRLSPVTIIITAECS